ncbi:MULTISPECIES: helix-turn-helix domain-containing protein [Streptomyces]|uniref:LuxR-family transcriptional regulator n=1 Tax=Streptomyces griseus subsp. griseus (strain JCM 4626 / CBS 651.72 / NBRC 13350 / KCC S-0626 / ISP 5235) TaxID=455632 RepID=B1W2Q1_STRGG|nr:helix-turn-helix transcriptional regulator [Streptomyces griseus]MBW3705052.1 LuxR family transcriptional regulator [Streptomyces griseus]BAG19415.1 putative LuxR-family transcriptional regulator [Streptomyces griseus subsp. griseus NBRC 13350]SEE90559.1 regulatory protein, luxR family [Streptomyces griseus]
MGIDNLENLTELSSEVLPAYEAALREGCIARDTDLPGVDILLRVGLLEPSPDERYLQPVDPRLVEARLAAQWRTRAWQLELQATEVEHRLAPALGLFMAQAQPERATPAVEYVHGMEAIREYVSRVSGEAAEEILTAQPGGGRPAEILRDVLPYTLGHLRRGVRMRTLYQHPARFDSPTKAYVQTVTEEGGEVRTMDEFFERLFVIDRTVAILPTGDDRTSAAVIHDEALVRFLTDVFDRNWQRAAPFAPTGTASASAEIMPDIHNMIRRLLIEGLTDSVIARRIGISERTYHNHLARIRESVGARSRLQLGYLLAKEEQLNGEGEVPVEASS